MSSILYPKPLVLTELPKHRHGVIEASAGTGKTYTLEHLVIDLIISAEVRLDEILVVTFTEKAAAELRARIRLKLTEIVRAQESPPDNGQPTWTIDEPTRERLSRALMSFDAASISTIHGFCHRMLGEHAFDNLRLFSEELVDGRSAFARAFYSVLRRAFAKEERFQPFLEAWLDDQPLDALVTLLFDAHARRGQIHPPLHLDRLDNALRQATLLPLAPNHLRPALKKAGAPHGQLKAILRRIALLKQILERYHRSARVPAFLCELGTAEHKERANEGVLPYLIDRLSRLIRTEGTLKQVRDGLQLLQSVYVPLESAVVQVFLPQVQTVLAQDKAQRGELDFDDMLGLLQDSLHGPAAETLVATLRERYRFALIDEFQDTDEIQWNIFRRLFLDKGAQGRLFVIGDPKQAIYGFRGADVNTYLGARKLMEDAGASQVHLVDNFRSSQGLIDAVNILLQQKAILPFFTGEIRYDHPVRCGNPDQAGIKLSGQALAPVHLVQVNARKKTLSGSGARRTLAKYYAERIAELLAPQGDSEGLKPNDIFVLTRSGKEGLEVAAELRRVGVPYAFYKQDGLFQTPEADDVRSVLAAIAEPNQRSRRLRAWQSPFFSVPLESLPACADLAGTHPFMKRLLVWRELADAKDYDRLFTAIIADSGIIDRELLLEDSERELTNYLHIFEILQEQASRSKGTLRELIHSLTAYIERRKLPEGEDGNVQRLESERDSVQVMTMHKAKGLEAAVVFVFGGYDAVPSRSHLFHEGGERCLWIGPTPPPEAETERTEEDQRLLYVTLTRAKAHLVLPYFPYAPDSDEDGGAPVREFKNLDGPYAQLNTQLDRIATQIETPRFSPLFSLEQVPEQPYTRERTREKARPELQSWQPPPALLSVPPVHADLPKLRRAHQGRVITSYSRIKASKGGYTPPQPIEAPSSEAPVQEVNTTTSAPDTVQLPGGTASGRFVHEMLERAPADSLRDAPNLEFWAARKDIRTLFEEGIRKYDRDPKYMPHTMELVFTALTAPLQLEDLRLEQGLCAVDRAVPEMEFLFPIPEDGEPTIEVPPSVPWKAERGFVKGFIDLVFEQDGRLYLLDWKSDLLPSYVPEDLVQHVEHNYMLQAEFYTLALVKLMEIHSETDYEARFGGAVYCFVRGMDSTGDGRQGVFFARPSWATVLASESSLRDVDLTNSDTKEAQP